MKKLIIFLVILLGYTVFLPSGQVNAQKNKIIREKDIDSLYSLNTYRVGDNSSYTTMQTAIDSASNGDVVVLYPGTYAGFTTKDGVDIEFLAGATVNSKITIPSGDTVTIRNLNLNMSGLALDVDGVVRIENGIIEETGSSQPAIDINGGYFYFSGRKIFGKIAIDSADAVIDVDSLCSIFGGGWLLNITGNSTVTLNTKLISPMPVKVYNSSILNLHSDDLKVVVNSNNQSTINIKNTTGTTGTNKLSPQDSSIINITNSYLYYDANDTTTGLHNIEHSGGSVDLGPSLYAYNTTFYFSGREGTYNTGGSTVALSNYGRLYSYNCTYIDGGDRATMYPQLVAVGNHSIFESYNDIFEHRGAASDALNGVVVTSHDSMNIKLYSPTFISKSGTAAWWNSVVAPTDVDTFIIVNPTNSTPDWLFESGRSGTSLDTAKVDFNSLNKISAGSRIDYGKDWFPHDVQMDSVLQIGDYSINSGTSDKATGGVLKSNSFYFDGIGQHDPSQANSRDVGNSMGFDWASSTLPKMGDANDTLLVTLTFNQTAENSSQSSYAKMIIYYSSYNNSTAMYEVITAGSAFGDADEYYFNVTEFINQGQGANPDSIQVVSFDGDGMSFRYPNAYNGIDGRVQVQVFQGINIAEITLTTY